MLEKQIRWKNSMRKYIYIYYMFCAAGAVVDIWYRDMYKKLLKSGTKKIYRMKMRKLECLKVVIFDSILNFEYSPGIWM